jgi:hypothetical protein
VTTIYIGAAIYCNLGSNGPIFIVGDGVAGYPHVHVYANTDGSITAWRCFYGGINTNLGSSVAGSFQASTWQYVEAKITVSDAAGVVQVYVDGIEVLNLTSKDTRADEANTQITYVEFGRNASSILQYDDVYILDGTGGVNDGLLGDVRVDAHYPIGSGANTDWAASAGSDYACCDETAPNGDTDYITTSVTNAVTTFDTTAFANTGAAIKGLQVLAYCEKTDAGTCTVAPVIRRGSTNYAGTADAPGTSYSYHVIQTYDVDPSTAAAWTEANFNAAEFGVKRVS